MHLKNDYVPKLKALQQLLMFNVHIENSTNYNDNLIFTIKD